MSARTKGILSIIASAFGFAVMALCVRLCDDFGGPVSSFQKSFFRNVIALVFAALVFFGRESAGSVPPIRTLPRKAWLMMVLRSVLGTVGIFANFYALSHITIAEGQTLNKTSPFFAVLCSWIFLGEKATARQIGTLLLAFVGVLFIAKPGFAGAAAFPLAMGLVGGMAAGCAYGCVRELGLLRVDGPLIVLFFSAFSCLASVPFMCASFDPMTTAQVLTLLGAGAGAAVGQFGVTAAYRFAAPRQIAVYDYTNILFTAIFGYLFFAQTPDAWSLIGFAVIIAAAVRMHS